MGGLAGGRVDECMGGGRAGPDGPGWQVKGGGSGVT